MEQNLLKNLAGKTADEKILLLTAWAESGLIDADMAGEMTAKIEQRQNQKQRQLQQIKELSKCYVNNVTDMEFMFSYCAQLTSLEGLEDWDVSKVSDMNCMFDECANLTSLEPIRNWNISSLSNAISMFGKCRQLTTIEPIIKWSTSTPRLTVDHIFSKTRFSRFERAIRNMWLRNVQKK